jgi:hypothetical protein
MNNVNILIGVLYLKEASDLLKNEVPDVSYNLLQLSQVLLENAKISNEEIEETNKLVDEITDISTSISSDISSDIQK